MFKHWEYTEFVSASEYQRFSDHSFLRITPDDVLPNTGIYVQMSGGGKRLEAIYDESLKGIRQLKNRTAPNRDLRLYMDAIETEEIKIIAVDGLMGTGKTSTCIESIVNKYLSPEATSGKCVPHKVLIAKPHVNAGGSEEEYGHLPGGINEKLEPTIMNYIQYFDRFHPFGFNTLQEKGYIEILPLGFIRGLDGQDMSIIVDEAQNSKELISVVTRKAENCRIFLLGDTSAYQIDRPHNSPKKNGLSDIIDLLKGAPYFQYVELKSLEHIVRSDEVRDIVRRLFKKYGQDPQEWIV